MNEFERVRLHPHWHGLAAVYGDFFHIIFRGTIYSTPSELHLISKEFSRQLTAYFTANPNELYEILKKCK